MREAGLTIVKKGYSEYLNDLIKITEDTRGKFSKTALSVFTEIHCEYFFSSNDLHLYDVDMDKLLKKTGFNTRKSIYDGLDRLEEMGVIKRTNPKRKTQYILSGIFFKNSVILIEYQIDK